MEAGDRENGLQSMLEGATHLPSSPASVWTRRLRTIHHGSGHLVGNLPRVARLALKCAIPLDYRGREAAIRRYLSISNPALPHRFQGVCPNERARWNATSVARC